jgi:hypothetical protein
VADGEYWRTTIVLVNLEDKAVPWTVKFFSDDGQPKEFEIVGMGRSTVFAGVLQQRGSVVLQTPGTSRSLSQGWANVESSGADDIGAVAIFGTRDVPGYPDYEAAVPAMFALDDDAMFPFDNTSGFTTSIAIVNSGTYSDSNITPTAYDERGAQLRSQAIVLKPGAQDCIRNLRPVARAEGQQRAFIYLTHYDCNEV